MPKLDWMMLANYAEAPPGGGLVYIMGGAWDTITVQAPLEGAPPGAVAAIVGSLAIRLLFHSTEVDRDHKLEIVLQDLDGAEVAKIEGGIRVTKALGLPPGWEQGTNFVFPLTGLGLPKFGQYTFHLLVDGQHLGERPFRVLKGY
ncbi:MAG TPA: hypothetical protein VGS09_03270 [Actinomycetota bacterium]|jgi:hypothetical protein|nr:hypothetical protein [Actinomycetota bacterium]